MPDKFGSGSKPEEKAASLAKARKEEDRGQDLLMAVLIGLGFRSYFRDNQLDLRNRQKAVMAIVMESSASMTSSTRDLIDGKVTPRVWFLRMKDILSSSTLAAAMALIGRDTLTDDELSNWASEFGLQVGYLTRFLEQIQGGEQILNEGAIGRSDLYARVVWSVANRVLGDVVESASADGVDALAAAIGVAASQVVQYDPAYEGPTKVQARRIRSLTDSCDDCVEWELLNWVDVDSDDFHEIGTSICGSRCKCHYIYRVVPA
jgi:hypothetical protein